MQSGTETDYQQSSVEHLGKPVLDSAEAPAVVLAVRFLPLAVLVADARHR